MTSEWPIVWSNNDWNPLEEVIVGVGESACLPEFEPVLKAYLSFDDPFIKEVVSSVGGEGSPYPTEITSEIIQQLDNFVRVLKNEGVTVTRPTPFNLNQPVKTPFFEAKVGFNFGNPRDVLLIIGDEIIEAPMAERSRFFEIYTYRPLIKEYFKKGAKWTTAPKPSMVNDLYNLNYPTSTEERLKSIEQNKFITTEFEPCFDAADFLRCGKDIFAQRSCTTNQFGIDWLRRHLGPKYRIHEINFFDDMPHHIDATLVPLRPGLVMQNPDRLCRDKQGLEIFTKSGWQVVNAPKPASDKTLLMSHWVSMNLLNLDEKRVIVEESEKEMVQFLETLGFKVIQVPFQAVYMVGGSFHCTTCDIRRRGPLESYFKHLDQ